MGVCLTSEVRAKLRRVGTPTAQAPEAPLLKEQVTTHEGGLAGLQVTRRDLLPCLSESRPFPA